MYLPEGAPAPGLTGRSPKRIYGPEDRQTTGDSHGRNEEAAARTDHHRCHHYRHCPPDVHRDQPFQQGDPRSRFPGRGHLRPHQHQHHPRPSSHLSHCPQHRQARLREAAGDPGIEAEDQAGRGLRDAQPGPDLYPVPGCHQLPVIQYRQLVQHPRRRGPESIPRGCPELLPADVGEREVLRRSAERRHHKEPPL